MRSTSRDHVLLLDEQEKPRRWVGREEIQHDDTPLEESGRPAVAIVEANTNLYDTLDTMITSYKGSAIIVDEGAATRAWSTSIRCLRRSTPCARRSGTAT